MSKLPIIQEQSLAIAVPDVGECRHLRLRIYKAQIPIPVAMGIQWQLQWTADCPDCSLKFRGSADFIELAEGVKGKFSTGEAAKTSPDSNKRNPLLPGKSC